ncbi:MAG: FKBP-type peptidyl-prolyl cis-trans isomerase, partial [Thermoanaerobaculia bacterium]|nr:FKBP-type peptidyl-prolyl cis-trans isomerase [Thermoanaerobaculia bacterium]
FDDAVSGMEPGQQQTIKLASEEAYGDRREELIFTVPKEQFPEDIDPEEGQQLQMSQGDQVAVVTVAEVGDDNVTLDANHPLAGQDLTFDIELLAIK